ncbi:uncharacterized protein LOC111649285 [Seriola lalandi dorsalis]|uniref:uncharacterized protein LOC111649285 n=1 Tax=Seriola lalandi dorsalis TaxID=1841481 RepID=UPI000C6F8EDF|nr:uncharacterized protein LOC111649285 [Seriola lalandi dorsalis]XP_023254830.1 uncharacterized protein LOC111649285 [Seriola lalandi dorsalis]
MAFLWRWFNNLMQVRGQVLLFLEPPTPKTQRQKLSVFLLPKNVPLEEVKAQQGDSVYIETSSECRLINHRSYSVHCPEAYKTLPHIAECNLDYGPNYHPTFEIFLPTNIEEVTITLQDPGKADVWKRRVELTGPGPAGIPKRIQDTKMKKKVLINILDDLREDEFKRFKWFLEKESLLRFRGRELEAERVETVELMVEKYEITEAVKMMETVLEKMSKYDLMKKLLTISSGTEGPGASKTPVSSPPAKDTKMKKKVLINILDDLREDEFKRFKWFLEKDSLLRFRGRELEAERVETVDLMVEKYGITEAVKMMETVLEKMSKYDLMKKLLTISSGTEGESDVKPDPNTAETKMDVSEDVKKLTKVREQPHFLISGLNTQQAMENKYSKKSTNMSCSWEKEKRIKTKTSTV